MSDELPPPSLFGLKTLDEKTLEAPDTRVEDAGSVRSIAMRMIIDDEPRSRERALTKGLLDGNSPYNAGKRKAAGQGWQANLNFMEGEASIDSAAVPYYQIFSGVKEYAVCKTKWGPDPQTTEKVGQRISQKFHQLLEGWREFDWHMQNCFREQLRWGYAPLVYDSGGSWKFKSIDSKAVMAMKDSASVVDDRQPCLMVIEKFTVSELWDKIKDEEAATAAGWNVPAVKRAIQKAAAGIGNQQTPWSATPWEEWQRRFKNNDLYWTANGQDVYTYRLLVKEFRKGATKISQFIVSQAPIYDDTPVGSGGGTAEKESDDAGFLFRHVDRYDSYSEALLVFFQNTGDGTWHSVRGMAMKGFKHWDASNRLKCKALDAAFQRCAIVLTTKNVKSADQLQLMVFSDRTILPPDTTVAQTGFSGDSEGVMAVDRMLTNHLANNLGVYNQRSMTRDDGRGEMPTAAQIQSQVAKEASLSSGQISITYTGLDLLYDTTFRKVVKSSDADAVAFREELASEGIPQEALENMECIYANRESGYGSSAMRMQNLQQLAPIVLTLPEEGKLAYNDMLIAATVGVDKVDTLNPRSRVPNEDDSVAAAENGSMWAGSPAIVSSGNDNVIHLQIHLREIERRVSPLRDALDQGGTPDPAQLQQAFEFLQLIGPHCEQHLAPLLRDPTRVQLAKQFSAQLQEYVAFSGKLRGAVLDARRQAAIAVQDKRNATALGEMDQAKLHSAQLADSIKSDKWATDKQIKIEKANTAARLATFKTTHQTTLNDYSTAAQIQREKEKTAATVSSTN